MAASCLTFVGYFRLVVPSIKDVFNTLITGSGRKGEGFPAGGFQPVDRIFVSQLQKPHTATVGLLFYKLGGKDCINSLMGPGADPSRPFTDAVAVPCQLLLVGRRHVLCNRAVLSLAAVQTAVGRNPVVVVKNFNGFICTPHINFALYVFMRGDIPQGILSKGASCLLRCGEVLCGCGHNLASAWM